MLGSRVVIPETNPSYTEISFEHNPIELIKLVCKLCRKEKGIVYASNTLLHSVIKLMTCKQGNDSIIEYMETIKLKNAIVTTQYGKNWLSSLYKDVMIGYHPETNWSGDTYDTCNADKQILFNALAKDRQMAAIGVEGCSMKMTGGGTLNAFLKAHAAARNNVVTCYP